MEQIIDILEEQKLGKVIRNFSLSKMTTYQVGGIAKCIVYPKDVEALKSILSIIKENNIKYKVLGRGSNVIFSTKEYDGVIIRLDKLNHLEINKNIIKVGSGYSLIKLANKAALESLTGLEFASGIPGSVGGAIFMNAGAYKSDMGYIVTEVKVLDEDLNIKVISNSDMNFHYRTSYLKTHPNIICLEATIKLAKGNKKEILSLMHDRYLRRKETQPLSYPSAGSVFRNPDDVPAGKLIENCNLKGKTIGKACVSEKHANFIINLGGATGEDIKQLIDLISKKVYNEYMIELKLEQELVNF